jgi:hypothetical protein
MVAIDRIEKAAYLFEAERNEERKASQTDEKHHFKCTEKAF